MGISIASNAVTLTTSKIINLIIQMVVTMLLSRFRTLEEYGTYSQILIVINLTTTIFMFGLPSTINYFIARAESQLEKKHFLSVYYTLSTILGAIIAIILTLSIDLIELYFSNPLISKFLYFLALIPWARILSSAIDHLLIVYNKTKLLLTYRVLNSISILTVVILTQVFAKPFSFYMLLYTIVNAIFALSVYFISSKIVKGISISFDLAIIKNIFHYSLPIGIASVLGTITLELDKLFISKVMDVEALAIYTNAAKELPITIISASLTAVLMPHIVVLLKNNRKKDAVELWNSAILIAFTINCLFVFIIFQFSKEVITVLYSSKYILGDSVFRIYTLVLLLRITYFGMILNATGNTKLILYSSFASLILNLVLNIVFFNLFGFIGPAIATFIATLAINLFQLLFTCRLLEIGITQIFPWRDLLKIFALNLLLGLIFAIVRSKVFLSFNSTLSAISIGSAWACLYFIIMRKPLKQNISGLNL